MLEIKDNTRLWKLTTADGYSWHSVHTHYARDYRWGWGVTREARYSHQRPELCTGTVIHAYRSPYHAVVFDAVHCGLLSFNLHGKKYEIRFDPPLLWEAEGEVVVEDESKVGVRKLTTWNTVDLPDLSTFKFGPNNEVRWKVEQGEDLFTLCGVTKENDAYSLF